MQKRCTRKEQAWLREEKWTDKNTKYIFFPLSLFNILSSFSYILIYNSYYPRYSTILFFLFNYNFIYLRLFLFSPSLFLLILNFSLSIFYLYPSLLFSALLFFHHSFISRFPILHLPSYSSYSFLQFPTAPPISSNPPYHSSFSFFRHSFPLFTTSSFQSSNSNLPSSHLISTLPRPLFLANHFSLLSVPFPRPSPNLLPLLAENAATDAAAAMNNGFRTQPCQLPPPRLNIHNAFLRRVRYEILHVQPRSTRRARARETGRRLWTGNKRVRTHRETHRRCREAWIVDKAPTILAGPAQHSYCLACFEYEIVRAENHAWF